MDVVITITYSTDNDEANHSISEILNNTLPYMVDNVEIFFDREEA